MTRGGRKFKAMPYSMNKLNHWGHDLLLKHVTPEPATAAAIAVRADIAGVTVTQATRILTAATQNKQVFSKRDPRQDANRHRQVYWKDSE